MTPEGRVKMKVKRALAQHYRFMPVQNGMGAPSLDFLYCICGKFVAVETKVPGKLLTDRQRQTAEEIAKNGGLVFVVRDDEDIVQMLQAISWHVRSDQAGVIYDTKRQGAPHEPEHTP